MAAPYNPRKISDHDLGALRRSLKFFGTVEPIVVNKRTNRIVGGHQRVRAAEAEGIDALPVVYVDLDDPSERQLNIALNKISGEFDIDKLAAVLADLEAAGADLSLTGFTDDEISELTAMFEEPTEGLTDRDAVPEPPEQAATEPGDLIVLGSHRLLCGDSTKVDDVKKLMGEEQAAICATDPPYLVDYTGERPNDSGKDWSESYREVDIKDADGFFRAVFTNVLQVLGPKGAIYCWHAHKRCGVIQRVWEDLGVLDHQQIIWVKPTAVFGRVYWHFRHEPCAMGWRKGEQPEHDGNHEHNSVWLIDWEGKSRIVGNEHPTQKPVEIFTRPIVKHTKKGAVCFEPFGGSGSQIIAAEQTGRRCFAIEIEPTFCDVIARRWQNFTGKQAEEWRGND
ncbi:MAG: DNA modification methylase [bacterium]|nr:DNA modification methylase [bacterium]